LKAKGCISIAGSFSNTTNVGTDAGMTGKTKLMVCLYKYSRIKALYCQQTLPTTSDCTRGTLSNQLSYWWIFSCTVRQGKGSQMGTQMEWDPWRSLGTWKIILSY